MNRMKARSMQCERLLEERARISRSHRCANSLSAVDGSLKSSPRSGSSSALWKEQHNRSRDDVDPGTPNTPRTWNPVCWLRDALRRRALNGLRRHPIDGSTSITSRPSSRNTPTVNHFSIVHNDAAADNRANLRGFQGWGLFASAICVDQLQHDAYSSVVVQRRADVHRPSGCR